MRAAYRLYTPMSAPAVVVPARQHHIRPHPFVKLASLSHCKTANEAIAASGMNFIAEKRPLLYPRTMPYIPKNGLELEFNPEKVSVHHQETGQYFGTVGTNYGLIQYKDIFDFTEIFLNENEATYQHGGISGGGKDAYLVMKTNEFMEIAPGDKIECYFYFTSSHDGTSSLNLIPSPLRPSNGTYFVLPEIVAIKFKHSKYVKNRLHTAKKSMENVKIYFSKFKQSFELLGKRHLTDELKDKYLKLCFPDSEENPKRAENVRDKIKGIMETEASLQLPATRDTLLGAYFAVVLYADHYMTVRKSKKRDEITARIEAAIGADGAGAKRKAEALGMALAFKG